MTYFALAALTRLERGTATLCRWLARPLERRMKQQMTAHLEK